MHFFNTTEIFQGFKLAVQGITQFRCQPVTAVNTGDILLAIPAQHIQYNSCLLYTSDAADE